MNKQQIKQAARETVAASVKTITDVMSWVAGERGTFEQRVGRYEVQAAIALSLGADAKETLGTKETWTEWGLKQFPGMSKQTLYRWRNAGHVARVLQGDGTEAEPDLLGSPPQALVGSLVPLYRVLDLKARSDEARAQGRTLARTVYSDLLKKAEEIEILTREGETVRVKKAPLFAEVLAEAEAVSPTNRGGGGKADEETKADEAEAPSGETETETPSGETEAPDEGTEESRRESASGLVTVDPAAVERAAIAVGPIVAGLVRDTKVDEETVRGIMLAALRLAGEHGIAPVQVLLTGKVPTAEQSAEETETKADEAAVQAEAEKAEQTEKAS